ncbi:MCM helicase [Haloarcula tailed virus 3]|uniref:DNA helicase n=1 Tax=Haloarcula tailed virus 3 TaxID=2877990 RepID=A0AAE8XZ49_9CAUD|nr:DNA helicase [Haloarcula tailed virus 3]UBF23417.1 MCM helicase [Haloarcula tailed virus 3]
MSNAAKIGTADLVDDLVTFYRDYYRDELGSLANKYPKEQRSLVIDWMDLYRFDSELADSFKKIPKGGNNTPDYLSILHEALYNTDLPIDIGLQSDTHSNAHIRVRLPENEQLQIGDLRQQHKGQYIAIRGQIERVSEQTEYMKTAHFACTKCGSGYDEPQPRDEIIEPDTCTNTGCSGKPSWQLVPEKSEMVDLRVMKIKQPPEEASGNGKSLTVYLEDDLAFSESDRSLAGMAGERVVVHGILKRDMSNTRGRNTKPMFSSYVNAHVLEFENTVGQDIDMSEYKDEIESHADVEDTLERLIKSFAPNVAGGQRIRHIKRAALLYLFGGYRKANMDGSTYRGDIHFLMVGDPATGKSSILNFIERVSPRIERLSGTDSTGVGLTASAEQTEGGQWVLKPGMLPRASGGHAIVDELDKMENGADNLHEALESQRIHTAKAGMKATLKTETGLIAAANPSSGRFGDYSNIIEEIDVDPALFSRFDIIHTLRDKPDAEKDRAVAEATLDGWQSAGESDKDVIDVPVQPDTIRAWVAHAKSLEPRLSDEAKEVFIEFYEHERTKDWGDNGTVPITARELPGGARLAEAHARMNLRDEVTEDDARIAVDVIRGMMGDIYETDGSMNADYRNGEAITNAKPESQEDRIENVQEAIRQLEGDNPATIDEIKDRLTGIKDKKIEYEIQKLKQQGEIYEPRTDKFRVS